MTREQQILALLADGGRPAKIAHDFGVKVCTIYNLAHKHQVRVVTKKSIIIDLALAGHRQSKIIERTGASRRHVRTVMRECGIAIRKAGS